MLVVGLLKGEGAGTELACVWHFTSVQALVLLQKILGGEELGAYIALPILGSATIFRCCRRGIRRRYYLLLEHAYGSAQRIWLIAISARSGIASIRHCISIGIG